MNSVLVFRQFSFKILKKGLTCPLLKKEAKDTKVKPTDTTIVEKRKKKRPQSNNSKQNITDYERGQEVKLCTGDDLIFLKKD